MDCFRSSCSILSSLALLSLANACCPSDYLSRLHFSIVKVSFFWSPGFLLRILSPDALNVAIFWIIRGVVGSELSAKASVSSQPQDTLCHQGSEGTFLTCSVFLNSQESSPLHFFLTYLVSSQNSQKFPKYLPDIGTGNVSGLEIFLYSLGKPETSRQTPRLPK